MDINGGIALAIHDVVVQGEMIVASKYVTLTLSFEQEGDVWVGDCLELGTSTYADTLEACEGELRELVVEHLNVLEEIGERPAFFEEWGITLHSTPDTPNQFTIRGSGDSWARLFQDSTDALAPFLRPRIFPIQDREGEAAGQLVGA